MPVVPLISDADIVKFAKALLDEHDERFRKDIKICLTGDAEKRHAYFPGLITCIGFADLLSGLHAGKIEGHGLSELKNYASNFMDSTTYDSDCLDVLYECFRHKVAHLSQPYVVFDTHSKSKFRNKPRRLITWTVLASRRKPAIEIVPITPAKQVLKSVTPWPVQYDHRVFVSVRSLASDIVGSIPRYLRRQALSAAQYLPQSPLSSAPMCLDRIHDGHLVLILVTHPDKRVNISGALARPEHLQLRSVECLYMRLSKGFAKLPLTPRA
jgi:hypothetical protein